MRPRALSIPLLVLIAATPASADGSGGVGSGGATADNGGLRYGEEAPRVQRRPIARTFRVSPRRVRAGKLPKVAVRIEQKTVRRVRLRIALIPVGRTRAAATLVVRNAPTSTLLRPHWPKRTRLAPGRYVARLHVTSPDGATLRRRPGATGKTTVVVAPKPKPKPKPKPRPRTQPAPAPAAKDTGVFPVAGPYTIAGDGGRFGSARKGYKHQGHDILAPTGTPVVAPLPGTVLATDYQRGGAGFYVAMDADDGRSFFFAHCRGNSTAVQAGQRVAAGDRICLVGSSGRSTGPHLHFEIWEGGWRHDKQSRPVDPLPQLRAWER